MRRSKRATAVVACLLLAGTAAAYPPDEEVPKGAHPADAPMTISPVTGGKSDLPPNGNLGNGPGGAGRDGGGFGTPAGAADDPHGQAADPEAIAPPAPTARLEDVSHDVSALPEPVRETRRLLLEAARTGDIEALRPVIARHRTPPVVAGMDIVEDPVSHLKRQSGDAEGREILAILIELLESGYVRVGPEATGTYVWPYFAEVPLETLADRHYVELYRILTAIDVEEMARQGRYTFFRVGIAADGRLRYFTAGDLE